MLLIITLLSTIIIPIHLKKEYSILMIHIIIISFIIDKNYSSGLIVKKIK